MYKAELTIPTEQYGNIRPTVEGTAEEIVAAYYEFKQALGGTGVSTKIFNEALDRYLLDNTGETEVFQAMSPSQKAVFQEIKKSLNRIKAKQDK